MGIETYIGYVLKARMGTDEVEVEILAKPGSVVIIIDGTEQVTFDSEHCNDLRRAVEMAVANVELHAKEV